MGSLCVFCEIEYEALGRQALVLHFGRIFGCLLALCIHVFITRGADPEFLEAFHKTYSAGRPVA